MRQQKLALFFLLLAPLLVFLHFSDGVVRDRQFINYDDLDLIKPMLDKPFSDYFSSWLPDRNNHAYPLRDLTYFADQWLGEKLNLPFYWFTQIGLLILALWAGAQFFRALFPNHEKIIFILLTLMAFHPLNIEVVQWLMIRKHLMAMVFLWFGSALVLLRAQQKLPLKKSDWFVLWAYYLASLLTFPTGLLWMPWVLWMARQELYQKPKTRLLLYACTGFCIAIYLRLTTTGESDYGGSLSNFLTGEEAGRLLTFAWLSLGRGFWNLIMPFWLAPYYSEASAFTILGFILLVLLTLFWRKNIKSIEERALGRDLTLLALTCLAPSALVFIGFPDFVWADRYGFIVLPPALALLAMPFTKIHFDSQKNFTLLVIGVTLWMVFAIKITVQRVPLWRDAVTLMNECAQNEKSPKCMVQTAQRAIHRRDCAFMQKALESGRQMYANRPSYNTEFKYEMPFYDAICIALSKNLTPEDKLKKLPYLFDQYEGAGEIMFSIILANLEAGQGEAAYGAAKAYFLSGDPRPLISTRNTVNIYRGAAKALCELIPDPDCTRREKQFLTSNHKTPQDPGYKTWGYNLVMTMAKRAKQP